MRTNTQAAIIRLATEALQYFVAKTRRDGEEAFIALRDDRPDWLYDAVREAHGGMLPDDWRYKMIQKIIEGISEAESFDLDEEGETEIIGNLGDCGNYDLAQWLGSHSYRYGYCDDARAEGLVSEDASLFDRLQAGQYLELREIYNSLLASLKEEAERRELEEEERGEA